MPAFISAMVPVRPVTTRGCDTAESCGRHPPLAAQQDDRWQVTLDQDRYVWDVRLVRLDGDSLVVTQADSSLRLPVERITEIRLVGVRLHPSDP